MDYCRLKGELAAEKERRALQRRRFDALSPETQKEPGTRSEDSQGLSTQQSKTGPETSSDEVRAERDTFQAENPVLQKKVSLGRRLCFFPALPQVHDFFDRILKATTFEELAEFERRICELEQQKEKEHSFMG
jgi:hypothetical protein